MSRSRRGPATDAELLESYHASQRLITRGTRQRRTSLAKLLDSGWSARSLASELGVSPQTVRRWSGRWVYRGPTPRTDPTDTSTTETPDREEI